MRIVFFGSGGFAVPSLSAILAAGHDVPCVVTQPPRPAGRGQKLRRTPVAAAAGDAGLDVFECPDVNAEAAMGRIRALGGDVICVADFGQLIRRQVRQAAAVDAFNLHGSLLPQLRGASPVNWAIIRGHRQTGVTTFSLVDKMDAGGIYLQQETPIQPNETASELRGRLAQIGAAVVCRTLDLLAAGTIKTRPQDESLASSAPRLKKTDGLIDWAADAVAIRNLIHGTWGWPGARTLLRRRDGREVMVVLARASAEAGPPAGRPGRVNKQLFVEAGTGLVQIVEIKPAGKRLMSWRDFVNGYRVAAGDSFVSIVR